MVAINSNPGLTQGKVPTPAEWNSYFAAKQDALGFIPFGSGGGTLTGLLTTAASTSGQAPLNIAPGVTPSVLNNGDVWSTASGLFVRIAGSTISLTGGAVTSFAGGTLTGPLTTVPSTTALSGLNIAPGQVPNSPVNGDVWVTAAGVFARINGVTANLIQLPSIDALTLKASPVAGDEIAIWDVAGATNKKALVSAVVAAGLPTALKSDATANITVGYTFTPAGAGTISAGTTTFTAIGGNYQFYTNGGSHTLAAPLADSAMDILVTNNASAGTITFSGFTVGPNVGDALTTVNGNKFIISMRRINSVSTYLVKALQ